MNSPPVDSFESFDPCEAFDSSFDAAPQEPADPRPFFDRAGLAWIAACVAIAAAAGHWVPPLAEPNAWRQPAASAGVPGGVAGLGRQDQAKARPEMVDAAAKPRPAKPLAPLPRELF